MKSASQPLKIAPQPGPQTQFAATSADIAIFGGSSGGGKCAHILTEIPTVDGWTKLEDVCIGNRLIDENGVPCTVTYVAPVQYGKRCYEVVFSDEATIITDAEHLWKTMTVKERARARALTDEFRATRRDKRRLKREKSGRITNQGIARANSERIHEYLEPPTGALRTTEEIAATLHVKGNKVNHSIAVAGPCRFQSRNSVILPIKPYLLGIWLGDGTTLTGVITCTELEIIEALQADGHRVTSYRYKPGKAQQHGIAGLSNLLKKTGLKGHKRIPQAYLRASLADRLALLQGLMDSDGYCAPNGKMEFTTTLSHMAHEFCELVLTLGAKATITEGRAMLNGKDYGPKYRIYFYSSFPAFRLSRKLERQKLGGFRPTVQRRYITDVREVLSVPVKCIAVDSPTHMYLIGRDFIPTHNTFWLCCEPLRHVSPHKDGTANRFDAVIFRRTYKQIREAGGMWDETMHIYPQLRAVPNIGDLRWQFPGGAAVRFRHLQHETDKVTYQGAQICLLCFDQLEQFTQGQFWYLLQRNRSICGVKPYIRATCNPDPDCFLADLLSWWIGEEGYPIKERGGVIRYFIRLNEQITWAASPDELVEKHPDYFERIRAANPDEDPRIVIKSFTFIPASIYDNKILLEADPRYLANLYALPEIERERLLKGNWKIRPAAGKLFNRAWFSHIVDVLPTMGIECRFWDLAASKRKGADYTVGIKIRRIRDAYFISDMVKVQMGPAEVDILMLNTAIADYENARETATHYAVRWEIEPGASGLRDDHRLRQMLGAFDCGGIKPQGDKVVRAKPLAAASQRGDIRLLRGAWNEEWLTHMHHQPDWSHDDIMDASTGAYNALSGTMMTTEEVITMPWQSIGPAY